MRFGGKFARKHNFSTTRKHNFGTTRKHNFSAQILELKNIWQGLIKN